MKKINNKSYLLLVLLIFITSCSDTSKPVEETQIQEKPVVEQNIESEDNGEEEDNEDKNEDEEETTEQVDTDDLEVKKEDEGEVEEKENETDEEKTTIEDVEGDISGEYEKTEVEAEPKVITISAKKWEYTPNTITVKKGENVVIEVINTDTLHGISIPNMQITGNDQITVDTSKTGTFEFRCSNYCGSGHQEMVGTLIVE